jgi:hypothetical protein
MKVSRIKLESKISHVLFVDIPLVAINVADENNQSISDHQAHKVNTRQSP